MYRELHLTDATLVPQTRIRDGIFAPESVIRAIDFVVAASLLLLFAPLMAVIAIAILVLDPGPVLFAHRRIGRDGRTFACLKFRSMVPDAEERLRELLASDPAARRSWEIDHKLKDDPRISPFGRFLRRSSLDELPQLINVLRGEMSMIGPRPICIEETVRYGRYLPNYLSVRPGLSGLWQISGRSNTSYRRRIALDITYVRVYSVRMYLRIMVLTVPAILKAHGSC